MRNYEHGRIGTDAAFVCASHINSRDDRGAKRFSDGSYNPTPRSRAAALTSNETVSFLDGVTSDGAHESHSLAKAQRSIGDSLRHAFRFSLLDEQMLCSPKSNLDTGVRDGVGVAGPQNRVVHFAQRLAQLVHLKPPGCAFVNPVGGSLLHQCKLWVIWNLARILTSRKQNEERASETGGGMRRAVWLGVPERSL